MTMMTKIFAGGAGIAMLAVAAPAAGQYANPYGYASPRGYPSPYGYNTSQAATQRCTAAVQSRLSTPRGVAGIIGAVLGAHTSTGRVVSVTQVRPGRNSVRVRGLASSGANYGYGPYGVGAYGAAGYAYRPDLSFKCDVDYRGYVRDVDIMRRR